MQDICRWSGLTADDLKGAKASLHDVHAALLTRFSADTILIGHSLESDLVALRVSVDFFIARALLMQSNFFHGNVLANRLDSSE